VTGNFLTQNVLRGEGKGGGEGGEGGEGSPRKDLVGVCGSLPKTLSLFMTKICHFSLPYLPYDQTKNSIPYFKTVAADTVALNINFEGLLLMVLSIMMRE